MPQFTDAKGGSWDVVLTLGAFKRVLDFSDKQIDLLAINEGSPPLIQNLINDPYTQGFVLYCVLKPSIVERGISEEQFAELLGGESLGAAVAALLKGLEDFFRSTGRVEAAAAIQKEQRLREVISERIRLEIDRIDPQLLGNEISSHAREMIQAATASMKAELSGKSSTKSPESSG